VKNEFVDHFAENR